MSTFLSLLVVTEASGNLCLVLASHHYFLWRTLHLSQCSSWWETFQELTRLQFTFLESSGLGPSSSHSDSLSPSEIALADQKQNISAFRFGFLLADDLIREHKTYNYFEWATKCVMSHTLFRVYQELCKAYHDWATRIETKRFPL